RQRVRGLEPPRFHGPQPPPGPEGPEAFQRRHLFGDEEEVVSTPPHHPAAQVEGGSGGAEERLEGPSRRTVRFVEQLTAGGRNRSGRPLLVGGGPIHPERRGEVPGSGHTVRPETNRVLDPPRNAGADP